MSTSIYASPVGTADKLSAPEIAIRRYVKAIVARVSAWTTAYAKYLAAAAIYEHLSKLSDAELHRLGLSRSTLTRDISEIFLADRRTGDWWPGPAST